MIKNRTLPLSERRPFFNHEWTSVTFRTDSEDSVFLDNFRYRTQSPLIPKHGDFLISQEDLRRLYAPDLTIRVEGETIYFGFEYHDPRKPREILGGVPYVSVEDIQETNMQFDSCRLESDRGTFEMRTAPEMIEGTCYIPVLSLMEGAFGARILTFHEGDGPTYWKRKVVVRDTVSITFDPDFKLDSVFATNITNLLNKECGDIYGTYWFEEGNRLLTYRLYVPFHYDPTVPNKAVVYFPGGAVQ